MSHFSSWLLGVTLVATTVACSSKEHHWSPEELATLRSLSLDNMPALPEDPSNAVADAPLAAELGHRIYFDPRFSGDGSVSCSSCHQPARFFTDGLPRGIGMGTARRHTPSIIGTAYSPWQFWDGRRDSQWAQATGPMESAVEHGGDRTQYAHVVAEHYREAYEGLFGPLPNLFDGERFPASAGPVDDPAANRAWAAMAPEDRAAITTVFVNVGKSIAAYERKILHGSTAFDHYVTAIATGDQPLAKQTLSADQAAGLRLFIGAARCIECHNGPRLTNDEFHNIGLPLRREISDEEGKTRKLGIDEVFDQGREAGVVEVLDHPFNCLGDHSDASPEICGELRFVKVSDDTLVGAFKVPSLRNVAETAPYMHDGRFESLLEVLAHYNAAPPPVMGHSDLLPLELRSHELAQLEAFLGSLTGSVDAEPRWLAPPTGQGAETGD